MGKYLVLCLVAFTAYADDGVQSFLSHADYLVFASSVSWKYSARDKETTAGRAVRKDQCLREAAKLKPALDEVSKHIARYEAYEESRLAASPDDINTRELRELVRLATATPDSPQLANRVRLKRLALFGRVETTLDEMRSLRTRLAAHHTRWLDTHAALQKLEGKTVTQSSVILW